MLYFSLKRCFDSIFSVVLLSLLSPFLLLISLAIKLNSHGPILFLQDRIGFKGRVFSILKFRTMIVGAEKGGVYEKKGDKRVTKVGKILRLISLDELPQLLNIAKGDMSFIGPRPTLTYHPWPFDQYTIEQKKRFNVRPGVTGWAQVNGRKDVLWDQRIMMDIEYVHNCNLTFDTKIFFMTIYKVVSMQDNLNKEATA